MLQVKSGKGWLAFRRYRTRDDGHYDLRYRFRRASRPARYEMRAQLRETSGYPYLQGDSDPLALGSTAATAHLGHRQPQRLALNTEFLGFRFPPRIVSIPIAEPFQDPSDLPSETFVAPPGCFS